MLVKDITPGVKGYAIFEDYSFYKVECTNVVKTTADGIWYDIEFESRGGTPITFNGVNGDSKHISSYSEEFGTQYINVYFNKDEAIEVFDNLIAYSNMIKDDILKDE